MPTYPLSAPPITPTTERHRLIHNQGRMTSPHTGYTTVIDNFSDWEFQLGFAPQKRGSVALKSFLAWFDSLHGALGTFTYQPEDSGKAVTGKTVYSTGFAYATEVIATGWTADQATGLEAGDFFTLAGKLHRITVVPANANASGRATISFEPSLRNDVAATTAFNFATPTITLRIANEEDGSGAGGGSSMDPDAVYLDGFTAREAH